MSRLMNGSKLVRPFLALHLFDDVLVFACVVNCLVLIAACIPAAATLKVSLVACSPCWLSFAAVESMMMLHNGIP